MYGNNLSIETFDKDLWDALEGTIYDFYQVSHDR